MAFSDEYDFRKLDGQSGSKSKAQDFLQTKLYDQMDQEGMFDRTAGSSLPKPPASEKNDDDMVDAQVYNQLNEQNYAKSQKSFDPVQRARQAGAAANEDVNATNMFKGLRQSVVDQSDFYGASSTQRTAGIFGDIWNVQSPPEWKSPEDPEEL